VAAEATPIPSHVQPLRATAARPARRPGNAIGTRRERSDERGCLFIFVLTFVPSTSG
jgi:hypothetical protein